jgi:coenzyme F420-reducing hydrogenase delta subunit
MAIGPPGRSGREQLAAARGFLREHADAAGDVVVIACGNAVRQGAAHHRVSCAGNLHSSVVELLLRGGAAGVLVASCPPRDCRSREGPRWLEARLFEGREAELQERVDRRRVRVAHVSPGDAAALRVAVERFRGELAALDRAGSESDVDLALECARSAAESQA